MKMVLVCDKAVLRQMATQMPVASSPDDHMDREPANKLTTAGATIVMYRSLFLCQVSPCRLGGAREIACVASRSVYKQKDRQNVPKIQTQPTR